MPIVGLTHNADGSAIVRRSVTCKVSIGDAPAAEGGHPSKLDYFKFLRKVPGHKGRSEWILDDDKRAHYGEKPRSLWIVLMDDDPEDVLQSGYGWFTFAGRKCWGDGLKATRRTVLHPEGEAWAPCAEGGCPDFKSGNCNTRASLYFMLEGFPVIGSICRLDTTGKQSIREMNSALHEFREVTGGRLRGLRVRLTVRPEPMRYKDKKTQEEKTSTVYVLGLELPAKDLPRLAAAVSHNALTGGHIAGGRTTIEDEEELSGDLAIERSSEGSSEATPEQGASDAGGVSRLAAIRGLMDELKFPPLKQEAMIRQHGHDLDGWWDTLAQRVKDERGTGDRVIEPSSQGKPEPVPGSVEITDDDIPF